MYGGITLGGEFFDNPKKYAALSDQNYQSTPPNFHSLQSIRKIVCPGFAYKTTAGARSDTHRLVRDFSGDHTKVFKVRLRRDNAIATRDHSDLRNRRFHKSIDL